MKAICELLAVSQKKLNSHCQFRDNKYFARMHHFQNLKHTRCEAAPWVVVEPSSTLLHNDFASSGDAVERPCPIVSASIWSAEWLVSRLAQQRVSFRPSVHHSFFRMLYSAASAEERTLPTKPVRNGSGYARPVVCATSSTAHRWLPKSSEFSKRAIRCRTDGRASSGT